MLDLAMTSNVQNADITKFTTYMFLSKEISGWERFRVQRRPTGTQTRANTLAQSVLDKSLAQRADPKASMLGRNDMDFLISEEDINVETAKEILVSKS